MTGTRMFWPVGEAARPIDPWQLIARPAHTGAHIAVECPVSIFTLAPSAPLLLSQIQQAPWGAVPLAGTFMGQREPLGMQMRQEARPTLAMKQQQTITLRSIHASPEAFFASLAPHSTLKPCTVQGLDFSYYLVPREHAAYFLAVGSMSLQFGPYCFVVDRFIPDLPTEPAARLETLAAVHVYGTMVLRDHHLASMLELAVAEREGYIEWYLELLETKYGGKFRDLMFQQLAPLLKKALQQAGITEIPPTFTETPTAPAEVAATISAIRAKELAEDCRSHFALRNPRLAARFTDYLTPDAAQLKAAAKRLADFIVVADQLDAYLRLAKSGAMTAARQAVEAGHDWQGVLQQARVAWLQPFVRYAWELNAGILPPIPANRRGYWQELITRASEEVRTQLFELIVSHGTPGDVVETVIITDTVLAMDAGALLHFASAEHDLLTGTDALSFTTSTDLAVITQEVTNPKLFDLHRRLLDAIETLDEAVSSPKKMLAQAARSLKTPAEAPTPPSVKASSDTAPTKTKANFSDCISTVMMHCALDRTINLTSVFDWVIEHTVLFFLLDWIREFPSERLSTAEDHQRFNQSTISHLKKLANHLGADYMGITNDWLQRALRDLQRLLEIIHAEAPDHPWVTAGLPQVPRLTSLMVFEQLIEQLEGGRDYAPTDIPHAELRNADTAMDWEEFRRRLLVPNP